VVDDGILRRKADHLRIVAEEDVTHGGPTLLECVQLIPEALPELALSEIDTSVEFFGKQLSAPLMITSMTGGAARGAELNQIFAAAAAEAGIAFAVGSQRVLLSHPERLPEFAVRAQIPQGVLLGNIGAQQLNEHPPARIAELVSMIDADGICVHLNAAHELAQVDGDRDFRGLRELIAQLNDQLDGRVLVKETGAGISSTTARLLAGRGISFIDVAGAGGTSWPKVESYRADEKLARAIGETFSNWGMPTAACIIGARRRAHCDTCIIGSGGIVTGLDAARAMACGANLVGVARAVLLAYLADGAAGASAYLARLIHELKVAMLLIGCRDLTALREAPRIYTGALREWLATPEGQISSRD
jgi:isopentenyl-diphosphate delta-isomerase